MKKKIAMMMMALSLTFGVVGVPQTVFAANGVGETTKKLAAASFFCLLNTVRLSFE